MDQEEKGEEEEKRRKRKRGRKEPMMHGGLNESISHRLIYVDRWSLVGGIA